LPELFCGFERRRRQGPTSYPVACSPQAWAAATPFALVAAAIGCVIDPQGGTLTLDRPVLPKFLDDLTIRNITIGTARIDLRLARVDGDVTTAVLRRTGDVVVMITK
jgi:glycogen debranching enzyme